MMLSFATLSTLPGAADAGTSRTKILDGTAHVTAGQRGYVHATAHGRYCAIGLGHSRGPVQVVRTSSVKLVWNVPAKSRNGRFSLSLRCASRRGAVAKAKAATFSFEVSGGSGRRAPITIKSARLRPRDNSERFGNAAQIPGVGDPNAVSVQLPEGTGGGGFSTYLPFAQGTQIRSSQGPHGTTSHDDVYNFDAVDLLTPVGTPIHAGFSGVVARINTGCGPYSDSCGAGYGNYIYLKSIDGTCAQMGHLSEVDVKVGQNVTQYDVVGLSGVSGHTGGPHLHYNRVDCQTNRSLPWAPNEGGSLAEGSLLTSQNHAPEAPCTALQGGCSGPIQGTSPPLQGSSPPVQGGGNQGGGDPTPTPTPTPEPTPAPPARSIDIGWSGSHSGWIYMTLNGFSTGDHQYTCEFASGGNQSFTLTETSSPQTYDNGHTCYDLIHGDTVSVSIEGVRSNTITVP